MAPYIAACPQKESSQSRTTTHSIQHWFGKYKEIFSLNCEKVVESALNTLTWEKLQEPLLIAAAATRQQPLAARLARPLRALV